MDIQHLCFWMAVTLTNFNSYGSVLNGKGSTRSWYDGKQREKRNAVIHNTWPNGRIPYTISASIGNDKSRQICRAMLDIELHSCVKFIPLPPQNQTFDFVYVANHVRGCFADVGFRHYKSRTPYRLNLSDSCFHKRGTVEHELLHITGLYHEQSRPDRDKYIKIFLKNIDQSLIHNFDLIDENRVTTFGLPYDLNSVMHYSSHAFSINNLPTMLAKLSPDSTMGQREGPSTLDFYKVYLMYRCNETGMPTISPFKSKFYNRMNECIFVKRDPNFDKYITSLIYSNTPGDEHNFE